MLSNFSYFAIDTLSYSVGHSLDGCIRHLADKGCRALQLSLHPGILWPSEMDGAARSSLRRNIHSSGMSVVSVNLPGVELNLGSVYPEMRAYTLALLTDNIKFAGDLGAPAIVIAPGKPHPLIPVPKSTLTNHFYKALDILLPLARKLGTTVCVENTPSSFLPDTEGLIAAIESFGNSEVGVCYDLANGYFVKEDLGKALRRIGPRLKLVHVADTTREVARHAAVGQGSIAFAEIAPVLREIGYGERPVLEVISLEGEKDMEMTAQNLVNMGWADISAP